jgi:hypothetical protein
MRVFSLALASALLVIAQPAVAQNKPNLFPKHEIKPQTDSERLQNFKTPPDPPKTYPNTCLPTFVSHV